MGGKLNFSSSSNSLSNVMAGDIKPTLGCLNSDELTMNSCKSLTGISSLVSDAHKPGANTEQGTKHLGISGTNVLDIRHRKSLPSDTNTTGPNSDISPSWKHITMSAANNINNNTLNSSGENSTTSLNESTKVRKYKLGLNYIVIFTIFVMRYY